MAGVNIKKCRAIFAGGRRVSRVYSGSHLVYSATQYGTEQKTEVEWREYVITVDSGTRSGIRSIYEREVYGEGEYGAWRLVSSGPVTQEGIREQQPWVYDWQYTGTSTRTARIVYTFPDAETRETTATETGGERVLLFTGVSGSIEASGSGAIRATLASADYWPAFQGGELIRENPVTDAVLIPSGGFSASMSGSGVTVTRGNNTTPSAVSGSLSAAKAGFSPTGAYGNDLPVSQPAGVESVQYTAWSTTGISLSASQGTAASPLSAAGGTSVISATAAQSRDKITLWNGIETGRTPESQTISVIPSLSVSESWLSVSGTGVTADSRGTVAGEVRQATVTGSYDSKTGSLTLYQAKNEVVSSIESARRCAISPASRSFSGPGGSFTCTVSGTLTRVDTYSSGADAESESVFIPSCAVYSGGSWISLTDSDAARGSYTFTIAANTSTSSRSGSVRAFWGTTTTQGYAQCTVSQGAVSYAYTVEPLYPRLYVEGGTGGSPQLLSVTLQVRRSVNGGAAAAYTGSSIAVSGLESYFAASGLTLSITNAQGFHSGAPYRFYTYNFTVNHNDGLGSTSSGAVLFEKTYRDYEDAGYPTWGTGGITRAVEQSGAADESQTAKSVRRRKAK